MNLSYLDRPMNYISQTSDENLLIPVASDTSSCSWPHPSVAARCVSLLFRPEKCSWCIDH